MSHVRRGVSVTGFHVGNPQYFDYTTLVGPTVAEAVVTAEASNPSDTVTISPADADPDTDAHEVALAVGTNVVKIVVQPSDDSEPSTYTLTVTRLSDAPFERDTTEEHFFGWEIEDPYSVASDGIHMWAAGPLSATVVAYDLASGERRPALDISPEAHPHVGSSHGVTVSGTTLWVLDPSNQKIHAFDAATAAPLPGLTFDSPASPGEAWTDGETFWVHNGGLDSIAAFDAVTGEHLPDKSLTTLVEAGNTAVGGFWSDGDTMWVSDWNTSKIFAYDLATGERQPSRDFDTLATTLAGIGNHLPAGLWSDGNTMWVSDFRVDKVYAYNMPPTAMLSTLEIEGFDFGSFRPGRRHYSLHLPMSTASVTLRASAASRSAQVSISPADADDTVDGHQVEVGTDPAAVTVSVVDGDVSTSYTVRLSRSQHATVSSDATLSALELTDVDLGVFDSIDYDHAGTVDNSVSRTTVTATPADLGASVTISTPDADAADGYQIDLDVGTTSFEVTVDSSDGQRTQIYRVRVDRAAVGDYGWAAHRDIMLDDISATNGGSSHAGGVWSDGTIVWVVDQSRSVILAYDRDSGTRLPERDIVDLRTYDEDWNFTGNWDPRGIWSDGDVMWAADWVDDSVFAYSLADGTRRAEADFELAYENNEARGMWSDGTTMWITDVHKVFAYVLETGQRDPSKDLDGLSEAGNSSPWGLCSDGEVLWVTDTSDAKTYAYSLDDGSRLPEQDSPVLAAAPRGAWCDASHLFTTSSARRVHVFNMPQSEEEQQSEQERSDDQESESEGPLLVLEQRVLEPDEIGSVVVSSGAPGELSVSWGAPGLVPFGYRVMWAREDLGYLSYWQADEAHRGNVWPDGGASSVTLSGLEQGASYKVQIRARFRSLEGKVSASPWTGEVTAVVSSPAAQQQADEPDSAEQQAAEPETETDEAEAVGPALTAGFEGVPDAHSGAGSDVVVRVRFSEPLAVSYVTMRDGGGVFVQSPHRVVRAKRVEGRSDLWDITVRVGDDRRLSVTVFKGSGCDGEHAVCTADGRPVSEAAQVFIEGPSS
ncbi:cadherin-like beta sandwich domain-containing protein [Candidatus Poriferisodalis sp.]|uniref:cadherin-like beta sandwich domain-containing protein n=1 Tax=Candidatus Poriferisodalis sp. TaxID=3101277 RepID=UPI003B021CF5